MQRRVANGFDGAGGDSDDFVEISEDEASQLASLKGAELLVDLSPAPACANA